MGCCGTNEEAVPPEEDDGPKVRSCTDVLMLILFIAFWFLLILIAAFAFVLGNPKRLIHGYDSFGNVCGSLNEPLGNLEPTELDMRGKPYLFYLDASNISKSLKICVSKCPTRRLDDMKDLIKFYNETGSDLCGYRGYGGGPEGADKLLTSSMGPCPVFPVYDSLPVLHRCVPKIVKDVLVHVISSIYTSLNSWDAIEQALADIYATWPEVICFCLLAFLVSLVVIAMLHYLASIVAWILMIFMSLASLGCTGVLWWTYATIKWELNEKPVTTWLIRTVHNEKAFLTFSIIATVFTVILLLLVLVMRKHVSFVSEVFKESAKCLADVPTLFLQPVITFLFLLLFFAFWIAVAVSLATANYPGVDTLKPYADLQVSVNMPNMSAALSTGSIEPRGNYTSKSLKQHESFKLVQYVDATWVKYMWWFHVIGLIWTSEFILGCQQMVIAGAVAGWYFKREKESGDGEGNWYVLQAVRRLLCYHTGSVALGAFLITLFKIPRLILMYLQAKLKAQDQSEAAKCCMKACTCCFYCLECFIRFMNHNAYTVVAMQGTNFCSSARIAFSTISSNVIKFTTLNSVGDFILFLGKVLVTLVTTIAAIVYLKRDVNLHFYAVPVLLIAVFAFFIAHAIISLYEGVVDTLFLCLCEDSRLNREDGKWKESKLVALNAEATAQELTPINE